jgi:hypothetical protein
VTDRIAALTIASHRCGTPAPSDHKTPEPRLLRAADRVRRIRRVNRFVIVVGTSAIDHPAVSALKPSAHQPSPMLRCGTPFSAAFMPLVPLASRGLRGLLSQTSQP